MGRNGEFFNMAFESVKAATSKKSAWRSLDTWRLYYDIWKFHYFSLDLVGDAQFRSTCRRLGLSVECTVGEYLNITGYSRIFIENYFLPMVQLLWNVESEDDLRALPVQHLISFLWNTGLLTHYPRVNIIKPDPNTSLTSRNVVPLKKGNKAVHLRTKVTSVTPFRSENRSKVRLTICGNGKVDYDYVILAVSAQEALRLLSTEATELQRDVLGAFQTTRTRAWLHWDSKVG